jgi:hypothetical protein
VLLDRITVAEKRFPAGDSMVDSRDDSTDVTAVAAQKTSTRLPLTDWPASDLNGESP